MIQDSALELALETPGSTLQGKSTARKRQRAAESPDHRALGLERQREYKSRGLTVVHYVENGLFLNCMCRT